MPANSGINGHPNGHPERPALVDPVQVRAATTWLDVLKWSLPMVIVVAGWLVNHVLATRAQRKALRLQVLDRARLEMVQALRDCQQWINKTMSALHFARELASLPLGDSPWSPATEELWDLINHDAPAYRWVLRLEEYEILFPETRGVRLELERRTRAHSKLVLTLYQTLHQVDWIGPAYKGDRRELAERVLADAGPLRVQGELIGDLIIHIQNLALHRISGRKVPLRRPADRGAERVEVDPHSGDLVIRQTTEFDAIEKGRDVGS
jgi:hypothetical protein